MDEEKTVNSSNDGSWVIHGITPSFVPRAAKLIDKKNLGCGCGTQTG